MALPLFKSIRTRNQQKVSVSPCVNEFDFVILTPTVLNEVSSWFKISRNIKGIVDATRHFDNLLKEL